MSKKLKPLQKKINSIYKKSNSKPCNHSGGNTIKEFPCHTQATERIVKGVMEAAAAVCGASKMDRFIRNRLKSRNLIPVFNTKHDYRPL
ncbi:hypothetical protein AVEN_138174-1 [Araneus ventricosus]|uniref:Uncharacterized protein n=1 Tax=Araneus ventricosus TaxID=182803 RepID=A0A4Y2HSQ0_ARAVE|nr:hypothetical protein AVEN_138174-1 [Araneus ventricosus]